jgi:hypothetical protein
MASQEMSAPPAPPQLPQSQQNPPECYCKKPTRQLVCKKEGPNKGRPFWSCAAEDEILRCHFFFPADNRPWIRGRKSKSGDEFRPFKKYRNADSSIREVYSTATPDITIQLNADGMAFIDATLGPMRDKKIGMIFDCKKRVLFNSTEQ